MTQRKRTLKPQIGRPPKHGGRMLERALRANKLDLRTKTAKMLRTIGDDLAGDAGGWERLTARERLLVERCAAEAVILQSIEGWLFRQDGPVLPSGELLPVLRRGYVSHFAALTRALGALGLHPEKPSDTPSLEQYLAAKSTATPTPAPESEVAPHADAPGSPLPTSEGDDTNQ